MRKASIGNLSSFSMAYQFHEALTRNQDVCVDKMDDFGMLGGVGKLYGV